MSTTIIQILEEAFTKAVNDAVAQAIKPITITDIITAIKSASDEDRQALREALDVRVDLDDVRDCVDAVLETSLKNQITPIVNDALENIEADDINGLERVVTRIVSEDITFTISAD